MGADGRGSHGYHGYQGLYDSFLHGFSLGLRPMYCSMLYYSTLILLDFYLVSVGIVVCPVCRGFVKDPRTTLHYYFV